MSDYLTEDAPILMRLDPATVQDRLTWYRTQLAAAEQRAKEWQLVAESMVDLNKTAKCNMELARRLVIEECARVCDADFAKAPWREANELAIQIRQLATSERTDQGSS